MSKILLLGDSCIDEYCYGICERLSPEAPVPILKIIDTTYKFGMASNVYSNLVALGSSVTFITNTEQIVKRRYVDIKSGQHLLRVDSEQFISPHQETYLSELEQYDAVVISDYNKGFILDEHIVNIRRNFTGPIFLDTKKKDLHKFEGCFVKINNYEYSLAKSKCSDIIVTLGKEGARYKNKIFPAPVVEVYDVCGAGDMFLAGLSYKYTRTKDISDSIHFANRVAAISVQHRETYVLTESDLKTL